jgi:alkylation response protein AidB-like acyl-CoA dehydrogenase
MSREDQQLDPVKAYLSALGRRGGKSRMSKLSGEERSDTSAAMRVCGGAAFSKHVSVERLFRDAHTGAVMAPTGDVLREFIARTMLGMALF